MEHFQSSLTVKDLHNYKGVPYGFHMNVRNFQTPFVYRQSQVAWTMLSRDVKRQNVNGGTKMLF